MASKTSLDNSVEKRATMLPAATDSTDEGAVLAYNEIDKEMERRVIRKTDMVVLPLMCLVFFFQYLDKQSLSYAAVYGLQTDLKLKGNQFSWTSSMFYVGQLVSEYPFIYLMSRLPLAKFVGVTIFIWGGVCMCLAAPTTYGGFLAVRLCLGIAEGAVSPAFITITSIWYKKSEHAIRIGAWVSCNGLAQVVGSLLMYGIGQGNTSLAPWRVMFIVCGAMTSFFGVLFYFFMPAGPETAWFLNAEERIAAAKRLASEHDGGDKQNFSTKQLKESASDFKTYAAFAFGILVTAPAPVLTFASLVIKQIGYTKGDTLLYGSPSGAVQILVIWIGVIACLIFPMKRCLVVIALTAVPIVGCILLLVLPSHGWATIVGAWLGSCISSIFVILMSLNASNIKGNTKKSVANTWFFIGYCVGEIAFIQLWNSHTAPRYLAGLIVSLVAWGVLIILMLAYWFIFSRENKKRELLVVDEDYVPYEAGADVTDKEDLSFRYIY